MALQRAPSSTCSALDRREDRREQILATAAALFAQHGYGGVSIDQLGAAVGLTGPALYRHFPGKEAILATMLLEISESLHAGGERIRDDAPDPRGRLRALVDFHVAFALDQPDLIAVQFRDLGHVPGEERDRIRRLQASYAGIWIDALRERFPGLDESAARAAVHAVFGLINSTPHSARLSRPEMAGLLEGMAVSALDSCGS